MLRPIIALLVYYEVDYEGFKDNWGFTSENYTEAAKVYYTNDEEYWESEGYLDGPYYSVLKRGRLIVFF